VHRVGVVGITWRSQRSSLINEMTIAREERAARLPQLAAEIGARELVYLATCNRVEVTFASEGDVPLGVLRRRVFAALTGRTPASGEAEHALRAWQGEGALEHLLLLAAGLDSARIGENEVAIQLRDAADTSRKAGLLGGHLDPVFTEAFRVAKRVRPLTEGRGQAVSLADVAARLASDRLQRVPGTVGVVGVSPMTIQCAHQLARQGHSVLVINRTLAKAEALAAECGGTACALDRFRAAPEAVAVLILAAGGTDPILARRDLERLAARSVSGEAPLLIDLGVPPNVLPEDAAAVDVQRLGMEAVIESATEDRERTRLEFAEARAVVDKALEDVRREAAERLVGPMIGELRRRYRHTALEGVQRLCDKELAGLGDAEREAVTRWAETLSRRFAHLPAVGLRELAFRVGPSAVAAFFEATDPQLARELQAAADRDGMDFDAAPDTAMETA
jgi:glutamyl-tRNA reductase